MPWVVYKDDKARTLAGVFLRPGRQFLQVEEVDRLKASPAGERLFLTGELSMAEVEEAKALKPEPKPSAKSGSKKAKK